MLSPGLGLYPQIPCDAGALLTQNAQYSAPMEGSESPSTAAMK